MKKGRHRRYEEARALKHTSDDFDVMFEGKRGSMRGVWSHPRGGMPTRQSGGQALVRVPGHPDSDDSVDELFPD